jgi:hypothetical protein
MAKSGERRSPRFAPVGASDNSPALQCWILGGEIY